jgi:hypothetical protein
VGESKPIHPRRPFHICSLNSISRSNGQPDSQATKDLCADPHHRRLCRALVLGYSFVVNVLAGQPVEGALMTGLMAFVGLAYAAYYTRTLSRLAKAEQDAAKS